MADSVFIQKVISFLQQREGRPIGTDDILQMLQSGGYPIASNEDLKKNLAEMVKQGFIYPSNGYWYPTYHGAAWGADEASSRGWYPNRHYENIKGKFPNASVSNREKTLKSWKDSISKYYDHFKENHPEYRLAFNWLDNSTPNFEEFVKDIMAILFKMNMKDPAIRYENEEYSIPKDLSSIEYAMNESIQRLYKHMPEYADKVVPQQEYRNAYDKVASIAVTIEDDFKKDLLDTSPAGTVISEGVIKEYVNKKIKNVLPAKISGDLFFSVIMSKLSRIQGITEKGVYLYNTPHQAVVDSMRYHVLNNKDRVSTWNFFVKTGNAAFSDFKKTASTIWNNLVADGVDFKPTQGKGLNLRDIEIHQGSFKNAILDNADFTNTNITDCAFNKCSLKNAIFKPNTFVNNNISGTDFEGAAVDKNIDWEANKGTPKNLVSIEVSEDKASWNKIIPPKDYKQFAYIRGGELHAFPLEDEDRSAALDLAYCLKKYLNNAETFSSLSFNLVKLSSIDDSMAGQLRTFLEDNSKVPSFDYGNSLIQWLVKANKKGELESAGFNKKEINTLFGAASNLERGQKKSPSDEAREKRLRLADSFANTYQGKTNIPKDALLQIISARRGGSLYQWLSDMPATISIHQIMNIYHSLALSLGHAYITPYANVTHYYQPMPYNAYVTELDMQKGSLAGANQQFGIALTPVYSLMPKNVADDIKNALTKGSTHMYNAFAFSRIYPIIYTEIRSERKGKINKKVWMISEMQSDTYQKAGKKGNEYINVHKPKYKNTETLDEAMEQLRGHMRNWPENLLNAIINHAHDYDVDEIWMPRGVDVHLKTDSDDDEAGEMGESDKPRADFWTKYYDRPAKTFGGELKNIGTTLKLDPGSGYSRKSSYFYVIPLKQQTKESSLKFSWNQNLLNQDTNESYDPATFIERLVDADWADVYDPNALQYYLENNNNGYIIYAPYNIDKDEEGFFEENDKPRATWMLELTHPNKGEIEAEFVNDLPTAAGIIEHWKNKYRNRPEPAWSSSLSFSKGLRSLSWQVQQEIDPLEYHGMIDTILKWHDDRKIARYFEVSIQMFYNDLEEVGASMGDPIDVAVEKFDLSKLKHWYGIAKEELEKLKEIPNFRTDTFGKLSWKNVPTMPKDLSTLNNLKNFIATMEPNINYKFPNYPYKAMQLEYEDPDNDGRMRWTWTLTRNWDFISSGREYTYPVHGQMIVFWAKRGSAEKSLYNALEWLYNEKGELDERWRPRGILPNATASQKLSWIDNSTLDQYPWDEIKNNLKHHIDWMIENNRPNFPDVEKYITDEQIAQWAYKTFFSEYQIPGMWEQDPAFKQELRRIMRNDFGYDLYGPPYIDWFFWMQKAWDDVRYFIHNQRDNIAPDMNVSDQELARDWLALWKEEKQVPLDIQRAPYFDTVFLPTIQRMFEDKGLGDVLGTDYQAPQSPEDRIEQILHPDTGVNPDEGDIPVDREGNPMPREQDIWEGTNFKPPKEEETPTIPEESEISTDDLLDELSKAIDAGDTQRAEEIKRQLDELTSESSHKLSWQATPDRVKRMRWNSNNYRVLKFLNSHIGEILSWKQIAATLGNQYMTTAFYDLMKEGYIERIGRGLYKVTDEGAMASKYIVDKYKDLDEQEEREAQENRDSEEIDLFGSLKFSIFSPDDILAGYPFIYDKQNHHIYIGPYNQTHWEVFKAYPQQLANFKKLYEKAQDTNNYLALDRYYVQGRVSDDGDTVAFWDESSPTIETKDVYTDIVFQLQQEGKAKDDPLIYFTGGYSRRFKDFVQLPARSASKLSWQVHTTAEDIAKATTGAYIFKAYQMEYWIQLTQHFLDWGLSPEEVKEVMLSKYPRWLRDGTAFSNYLEDDYQIPASTKNREFKKLLQYADSRKDEIMRDAKEFVKQSMSKSLVFNIKKEGQENEEQQNIGQTGEEGQAQKNPQVNAETPQSPQKAIIRYPSVDDIIEIHNEILTSYGGLAGIMPGGEEKLDAAIGRMQSGFSGQEFYPSILEKAAVLCHSIITTHPFSDGNKRTGFLSAVYFLHDNGFSIEESEPLADVILEVANDRAGYEHLLQWIQQNSKEVTDTHGEALRKLTWQVQPQKQPPNPNVVLKLLQQQLEEEIASGQPGLNPDQMYHYVYPLDKPEEIAYVEQHYYKPLYTPDGNPIFDGYYIAEREYAEETLYDLVGADNDGYLEVMDPSFIDSFSEIPGLEERYSSLSFPKVQKLSWSQDAVNNPTGIKKGDVVTIDRDSEDNPTEFYVEHIGKAEDLLSYDETGALEEGLREGYILPDMLCAHLVEVRNYDDIPEVFTPQEFVNVVSELKKVEQKVA